ncbi:MAG TPA: PEGA domain-containing protein [Vicinamibacterales bacterium]|nr:PEGA domain-containing protein [Vicinamibacterales bacterium]
MDRVLPTVTPPATVTDGFGQRFTGVDSETGEQVELLEFAPEIVEHTGFVTALAERVARLASVRHASYVHLRRLDRPSPDRLQLVSDLTPGWRLSEMLDESRSANIPVDIGSVIALLRQLLPAVALFARHNRENAIGTLSPHRLIVTPQARLVIAEHAFGPAIDKLNLGREKLWRDFRISMPPSAGLPRANPRSDANAIGMVALALLLGRPLEVDEFPGQLETLAENAQEHRDGQPSAISASFKNWLKRALQFDVSNAFQTPSEAQLAFESVLASDRSYVTNSPVFTNWVNEIGGTLDIKRRPVAPAPEPEPLQEPVAQSAPVIVLSNGAVAEPTAEPELVAQPESVAAPELVAEPAPAPEPEEVAAVPEPIEEIVAPEPVSAAATDAVQEEQQEEIEIPLDESTVAAVAEPEPAPQPDPVEEAPRPAFTREELEEDPIARALLTYQPKSDPPPPAPAAEPELEPEPIAEPAPEPVAEVVEEDEVVEEEQTEAEPVTEPEPIPEPQPVARRGVWDEPPPPPSIPTYQQASRDETPAATEYQEERVVAVESQYEAEQPQPEPPEQEPQYEQPQYEQPTYEDAAQPEAADYEVSSPEVAPAPPPPPAPAPAYADDGAAKSTFSNPLVLGLVAVVVILIGVMGWLLTRDAGGGGMREGEGELVVQSRPEGAQVKIDGEVKGSTPLTVRLDAGAHVMEVQSGKSEPRVIPLMITAGVQTSQYVELQGVAKTGAVEIVSEPAGARITIDGRPRGTAPATITDLAPGDHTVVLEAGGRKNTQTVRIQAGSTAKLVVPMRR